MIRPLMNIKNSVLATSASGKATFGRCVTSSKGKIEKAAKMRRLAFMGSLLDVLPRCIHRRATNGEDMPGYYIEQLAEVLRKGAKDAEDHWNAKFLGAVNIGPCPEACREIWAQVRGEAMDNYNLTEARDKRSGGRWGLWRSPRQLMLRTGEHRTNEVGMWTRRMIGKGATNKDREEERGKGLGVEEGRRHTEEKDTTKSQAEEKIVMNQRRRRSRGLWQRRYRRCRGRASK
jgi:hypothetical protein